MIRLSRERGAEPLGFVGSMLAGENKRDSLGSLFCFLFIVAQEILKCRLAPQVELA